MQLTDPLNPSSVVFSKDVEKVIGVPPPELFSLHPLQSLYDACQLLVESRAHRLPLVDVDSETGEEMIVSVLTQYRILKFIAMNVREPLFIFLPLPRKHVCNISRLTHLYHHLLYQCV